MLALGGAVVVVVVVVVTFLRWDHNTSPVLRSELALIFFVQTAM